MSQIKKSLQVLGSIAAVGGLLTAAAPLATAQAASPCAPKAKAANPCAAKSKNPCAAKAANPCAAKPKNPCAAKK